MPISPLVQLFKEQLENESQSLARTHGLTKRGDFLIWWYFLKLRSLSSADVDQIVCDGGSDLRRETSNQFDVSRFLPKEGKRGALGFDAR
jgi:hypothetical protein